MHIRDVETQSETLQIAKREVREESSTDLFYTRLAEAVREVLNIFASSRKVREPYTVRVTEAISCLRKSYLNIVHGACPDNLYMAVGRYMHDTVLKVLQGQFKDIAEVVIEPKLEELLFPNSDDLRYRLWKLVAEPDMVVKMRTGETYVIELKFQLTRRDLDNVLPRYRQQLGTYVKMLNAEEGHLIVFKPDLSIYHEVVTADEAEKHYKKTLERARQLVKHIVKQKTPEPEQGIDCRTCPYRDACSRSED